MGTIFARTEDAFGSHLTTLNVTLEELLADTELLADLVLERFDSGARMIPDVVALAADLEDGQEISPSNISVRVQVVTADVELAMPLSMSSTQF